MNEPNIRDENYSKKILISLLFITLLVILVISLSLSLFIRQQKDTIYKKERVSKISMNYTENTNGISIENATPVSDEVGMKQTNENEYFDFTVNATIPEKTKIQYEIAAIKDPKSTIDDKDVKIYLEEQKNGTYVKCIEPTAFIPIKKYSRIGSPKGSMILKRVILSKSESKNYRLRMWLNKDSNVKGGKKYTIRINVYGKQIIGG